jgi:AcrR family transcriptional regulator
MAGMNVAVASQPSPRTPASGVRTRQTIVAAAGRLFASNGFHGVSMRQIAAEARVPTALVSYHFKSKLGLYRAVFQAHAAEFTDARVARLETFDASADPERAVRELLEIFVQPVIEMSAAPGGRDFARLVARETNEPREAERGVLAEFMDPVARSIISNLAKIFPDVDKATIHWAFLFSSGALAINHAATGRIERLSDGLCQSQNPREFVDRLIDFVTGGILTAVQADRARRRASLGG